MRLYRYWARAEDTAQDATGMKLKVSRWGGSNDNEQAAQDAAKQDVKELVRRIASLDVKGIKHRGADYAYSLRGLPEEMIGEADEKAGITRNRYGALVLNAAEAVFVDVDLPMGNGFFANLFGKGEKAYLKKLEAWLQRHPGAAARVYRTAAGMRYLITHTPHKVDDNTLSWLKELGSDDLYVKLCRVQDCYRARLSPKPWRVDMKRMPCGFPREDATEERAFKDWLREYDEKSAGYAVCRYVQTLGEQRVHPSLDRIVKDHDRATKAEQDLPLA
ncbi:MAG: hypothetical protein OXT65_12540 [Alphaproteobacteria bacterium]|nr:hypothetical protein [Alphaproteobacteria bacterium]